MEYKKTVVLMWNPQISSVKDSDYVEWFESLCTFQERFFNWSVWDHQHVSYGDRFILVRVGDENAGVVMEGLVASDCYEGDDWAGTERKRHYVDLVPMMAFNPESTSLCLSLSLLQERIPDFEWGGGHSGRVLTKEQSTELDRMLAECKELSSQSSLSLSQMKERDYVIAPSLIHPSEEENELYAPDDPRPFIDSLIRQSMDVAPERIERDWNEHKNMWVKGHEDLLRTAAWLAFPIRSRLTYYGGLCLKLAIQYWGTGNYKLNAAYAKEAADFLTDRILRHTAIMIWLGDSLRSHQYWGTGYAVDPSVISKITGLDILSDFLGYDISGESEMLHDYYIRKVEINTEEDFIDVCVSYDAEGDEEDMLTFHLTGNIEIDSSFDTDSCYLYIQEAQIGPWGNDRLQLCIDGYGVRARAEQMEIYLKEA